MADSGSVPERCPTCGKSREPKPGWHQYCSNSFHSTPACPTEPEEGQSDLAAWGRAETAERERDEALQRVEGLARALKRIAKWKPTMWDGESDLRADATEDFQDIARTALSDYGEESGGEANG